MLTELGGAPQPPAPQEMGAGASRPEPRHRSVHSRLPSTALFVNDTRHAVRTVWLDYRGRERAYALLQPGESYRCVAHGRLWCSEAPGSRWRLLDKRSSYCPPQAAELLLPPVAL